MQKKSQQFLINLIKQSKAHSNYCLFLGAGASSKSNIKTASQMIEDFRAEFTKQTMRDSSLQVEYDRHKNHPVEYSYLFEKVYDQPSQRREYIERCLANASPSMGYVYLANLIEKRIFNTIFTTNFDDLISETISQFTTSAKPQVCAHDSNISSIRITSKRPKIIKLHGDFLFDNIKNTTPELYTLEKNTKDKLEQFAHEFGLIVVGYAGNDRSIMETLIHLTRNDLNFPFGIYWCLRAGSNESGVSEYVKHLSRSPKFNFVEIDGFDELMCEANSEMKFGLPEAIEDPIKVTILKIAKLLPEKNSSSNEHLKRDLGHIYHKLLKHLFTLEKPANMTTSISCEGMRFVVPNAPMRMLADATLQTNDYMRSIYYSYLELRELKDGDSLNALGNFVSAIKKLVEHLDNLKLEEKLINDYLKSAGLVSIANLAKGRVAQTKIQRVVQISVDLITIQFYDSADQLLQLAVEEHENINQVDMDVIQINRLQIILHKGNQLSSDQISLVTEIESRYADNNRFLYSCSILKGSGDLQKILSKFESTEAEEIRAWPISALINRSAS